MKRKVLIHSLIFSPDGVSTAYLYNDIALKFKEQGYNVKVLTTTPHYNVVPEQLQEQPLKWKIWGICKKSNFRGIEVLHIPQKKFKSTALRLVGFIYWHVISFILGLCQRNVDLIISPSPPLTIGVINVWLAKIKGCKVVYNVQEIYPDILKNKNKTLISALKKIERYVYNSSSAVTTIDKIFYNTIVDRFKDKDKLHIIPNFVDTNLYNPNSGNIEDLDNKLFPKTNSIKLLYAGNIGYAQDWEPLVKLAQKTQNLQIEYFIIGEGVMKSWLEGQVQKLNLNRVHVIPYQPRSLMPSILAYSDLQFIFMNPKMDRDGFPSKVYTIMACGKPLLVYSGKNTPIVNFLRDIGCAKIVSNDNLEDRIEEMYQWLSSISKDNLVKMGNNGESVISKYYTKDIVTEQYVDLANHL